MKYAYNKTEEHALIVLMIKYMMGIMERYR